MKKLSNESDQQITNELHDALCMKETIQFWNIWKSKFESKRNSKPKVIDGLIEPDQMANAFASWFGNICKPTSQVYNDTRRDEFDTKIRDFSRRLLVCGKLLLCQIFDLI